MIFFHVGFPKSASTTLQKNLFSKHSQINFLGINPTNNIGNDSHDEHFTDERLAHFHLLMAEWDSVEYYLADKTDTFSYVHSLVKAGEINLISNERFTSVLFSHKDRVSKIKRIKDFTSDPKIIIVIRNQLDIIKSQYRDHPYDPRNLYSNRKFVSLDEWVIRDFMNKDVSFLQSIKYDEVVEIYTKEFGIDNVCIMIFEDLISNKDEFSKKISEFLGVSREETLNLISLPEKYRRF